MSDGPESEDGLRRPAPRLLGRIVLYGFLGVVLVTFLASMSFVLLQILPVLVSGWWFFLRRTVPGISWNWDLVGMGILCAVLILLGAQWILNWIWQSIRKARALEDGNRRWPWKSTWCGSLAVAMLFLVGMAVGGIAHQVGWMLSSPERMIEPRRYSGADANDMRHLAGGLEQAILETQGDVRQMRHLVWRTDGGFLRSDLAPVFRDAYHVLLIVEPDGKIGGSIIFPRDPERRRRAGCLFSYGGESGYEPVQKLDGILERHRSRLLAL